MAKLFDVVLAQANIRDVLQHYGLQIERNKVLCPFHDDKHASMSIDDKRQIVKCFSCGEGGNAISFAQKYEERVNHHPMSITEAAVKVVEICHLNIDISNLKKQNEEVQYQVFGKTYSQSERESLALLKRTNEYYEYLLNTDEGKKAKDYLLNRGLTEKIIKDLKLGFAQKGLIQKLKENNSAEFPEILLHSSGMMKEGREVFVDRVVFPISDVKGNVVGFGGRTLEDDAVKYLNTQETEVFQKSNILYNLNSAKNYAYNEKMYVVEGYMDVVGAKVLGIDNVVALMGTNLSESHIEQLKATKNEVILALDNDEAGKTATLKHIRSLEKAEIPVRVVDLSKLGNYKDFGDVSQTNTQKIDIENATVSAFHFMLEKQYFLEQTFHVDIIANEYKKLVSDKVITSTKHRQEFIEFVQERSDLSKDEIMGIVEPKQLDQQTPIEVLQNTVFQRYIGSLIKGYAIEKKDTVLEDYIAQNEQEMVRIACESIASNPIRYCDKEFTDVNVAMLIYDTLQLDEKYADFEKIRRFHYEEIFENAYAISGEINGQLQLSDEQKSAILSQFEKTIPSEEKLMLENVQEVYIVNEIQDIDKLLPNILHEARSGYIKESMQIEKRMSYLNYGSVFAQKQMAFLSERYVKDGKFKTILFFNNLDKTIQLTKDHLMVKEVEVIQTPQKEQSDKEKSVVDNHKKPERTRITCLFDKEDVATKDGFAYIRAFVNEQEGYVKVNAKNVKLKDEQYTLYTMSDFSYSFYDKTGKFSSKLNGSDINKSYEDYVEKAEKEDEAEKQAPSQEYQIDGKEVMLYG